MKKLFFLVLFLPSLALASTQYEISDGSVKYLYHFENLNDSSGNNYGLTDHGTATFTAGKLNNSLTLNGSTQYVDSPNTGYPFNTANFSVGFWFKMNSGASSYYSGANGSPQIFFDLNNNYTGALACRFDTTQVLTYSWTADTNWHYLVCTHSAGSGMKMYFDGTSVASNGSYNYAPGNPNGVFEWGSFAGLNVPLNGQMDEGVILSKELSSSDITSLYNSGTGAEICVSAGCAGGGTSTSTASSSIMGFMSPQLDFLLQLLVESIFVIMGLVAGYLLIKKLDKK